MSGITTWWDGIPGLDARVPYGDLWFADRFAALACAMRVCGTDPSARLPRPVLNVADKFLTWFQLAAGDERDRYLRRLTTAIACTNAAGRPGDVGLVDRITDVAELYRTYLTRPPEKRGGPI